MPWTDMYVNSSYLRPSYHPRYHSMGPEASRYDIVALHVAMRLTVPVYER